MIFRRVVLVIILATVLLTVRENHGKSIKIIGGVPTLPGEFPSVVYIRWKDSRKGISDGLCVGSIMSRTQVVTAAHCVFPFRVQDMLVVAGAHNIKEPESSQQVRQVYDKTIHPDFTYYESTTRNDIAILTVEAFNFTDYVKPLSLPPNGHQPQGLCWIAGWGQTNNATNSDVLLKAQLPVVDNTKCNEVYQTLFDPNVQLCAGHDAGGYDACMYDTGGPLICQDLGYKYMAGIVSWGYYCALPQYPGVYTKVSRYIGWM